ncbi:hypothetical protein GQ473_02445 [archaeon]|nr:hypothetical protein [archaeon]
MYSLNILPELEKVFIKLAKKNKKQVEIIFKKVDELLLNPQHYKNLKAPFNHCKRVHVGNSFVLVFSVDENTKTVTLEDYSHHDIIYR